MFQEDGEKIRTSKFTLAYLKVHLCVVQSSPWCTSKFTGRTSKFTGAERGANGEKEHAGGGEKA